MFVQHSTAAVPPILAAVMHVVASASPRDKNAAPMAPASPTKGAVEITTAIRSAANAASVELTAFQATVVTYLTASWFAAQTPGVPPT